MARIRKTHVRRAGAALAVVCLVLLVALFVHEYRLGGGDPVADGPGGAQLPTPGASGSVAPSGTTTGGARPAPKPLTLRGVTITPAVPGGIVFGKLHPHTVVLSVSSSRRVPRIGYIAPASMDSTSADLKNQNAHWSVTVRVVGKPYYAALFIQAGPAAAVTCRITVDGKQASAQTTEGPYGGKVCVG